MYIRIPKYVWIATVIIGLAMGIWPGVGLGQQHWTWMGVVLGWLMYPIAIYDLIVYKANVVNLNFWPTLMTSAGYLVAVPGYAVCAWLALKSTRRAQLAWLAILLAILCSVLASIPAAIIAMSINQGQDLMTFAVGYLRDALLVHGIIAIHLAISAALGWLLAWIVLKSQQRMIGRASVEHVSRETSME